MPCRKGRVLKAIENNLQSNDNAAEAHIRVPRKERMVWTVL